MGRIEDILGNKPAERVSH